MAVIGLPRGLPMHSAGGTCKGKEMLARFSPYFSVQNISVYAIHAFARIRMPLYMLLLPAFHI